MYIISVFFHTNKNFKLFLLFTVFYESGFTRTLCGGDWEKLYGVLTGSSARIGCCPSGTYMSSPHYAPFLEVKSCSKCPLDFPNDITTEPNDEISCNGKCPKGTYYADALGCQSCFAGKFNNISGSTGSSSCLECALGSYSNKDGSSSCQNCLGGKTTNAIGSSREALCIDCDVGRYSDRGASCQDCPQGYIGTDYKAYCDVCESGKFQNNITNVPPTKCEDCSTDTYTNTKAQTICKRCTSTERADTGSSVCVKCEVGQYMTTENPRNCENCAAGKFSIYGEVECTECDQGYYADKMIAATRCISCPSGWYGSGAVVAKRINESGVCNRCTTGRYSKAKGADSNETCIGCQPGKKAKDVDAATEEINACTVCLVGQYRPSTDDVTKCNKCQMGKTLGVKGGSKCIDCIPGRFSDQLGSNTTDCRECPIGYSTEEGAGTSPTKDKCVACLLGTYANTKGLTKCLACVAGKFSDVLVTVESEEFCKRCVVGQYRPSQIEVDGVMTDTNLTECKLIQFNLIRLRDYIQTINF